MRGDTIGISIGMVGLGSFGSAFVRLFKSHPLVDRIALCDPDPKRVEAFAKQPWLQDKFRPSDAYSSLDEICKSDVDALVVITQPWLHASQAVQAMEAGKHVYSAVPVMMAPDADELLDWCDKLIDTCTKTGLRYMMGETSYYRAEAMYCRRKAAEGAFGQFVLAEGEYFHDLDHPGCSLRQVFRARRGKDWAPKYEGDVPMFYPTHSIGGLLSVMKARMTKVSAHGYVHPNEDWYRMDTIWKNVMSNETALFHLSNGACARICEYRRIACHGIAEQFSLYGTQASFAHSVGGPFWCTMTESKPLSIEEMRDPLPAEIMSAFEKEGVGLGGHGGSHGYLVHEFVDSVAQNRQPAINAWESVRYFAPGVMAHKSALKGGELLDIPDWGDAPA